MRGSAAHWEAGGREDPGFIRTEASPAQSVLKKRGAEIPLGRIGQNGHNGLALAQLLCELQRGSDVCAAGNAAH